MYLIFSLIFISVFLFTIDSSPIELAENQANHQIKKYQDDNPNYKQVIQHESFSGFAHFGNGNGNDKKTKRDPESIPNYGILNDDDTIVVLPNTNWAVEKRQLNPSSERQLKPSSERQLKPSEQLSIQQQKFDVCMIYVVELLNPICATQNWLITNLYDSSGKY